MRTSLVKNGLVMGVILLFIGVTIQPAIAVNPISSDDEDDCSICPKVSNQQVVRLKSLIDRLEMNIEDISKLSWNYPFLCILLMPLYFIGLLFWGLIGDTTLLTFVLETRLSLNCFW